MSEDQSPDEKPFEATGEKLEEARRKGDIPRSADLNTALSYAGLLLGGLVFGVAAFQSLGDLLVVTLDQAEALADVILSDGGQGLVGRLIFEAFMPLAILMAAPAGLIALALTAQRGWIFAPSKLEPKLNRIGLLSNAKQKFGADGLFAFVKSAVKLGVYAVVLAVVLWRQRDAILVSLYGSAAQFFLLMARLMAEFILIVFLISLFIGGIDYVWQYFRHLRQNRMSRQEMMEAMKRAEGDPALKQTRRQRAMEIATNRMIADVPKADVVIVNPTHYAIALSWERKSGQVPICVAKGVDAVAARIREAAQASAVPIYHDPASARALYASVDLGAEIQPDHYRAVAAAIRFADRMRRQIRGYIR